MLYNSIFHKIHPGVSLCQICNFFLSLFSLEMCSMMILTTQFREQNKLSWFCFLVAAVFVSVSSKHLTDEENDKYVSVYIQYLSPLLSDKRA